MSERGNTRTRKANEKKKEKKSERQNNRTRKQPNEKKTRKTSEEKNNPTNRKGIEKKRTERGNGRTSEGSLPPCSITESRHEPVGDGIRPASQQGMEC